MKIIGFTLCIQNEGYTASLEKRKIYAMSDSLPNDPEGYVRVIDESGEDYLYPAEWFESVSLGSRLESRLMESIVA
jgi:hypothetical protein